eukprot:superscaffoldBa00000199_g2646
MPPLSNRHGIQIVLPEPCVVVEEVLLAVGEQVGHGNLLFASRMNKAVVFLKEARHVSEMIESGIVIRDIYTAVSPLLVPSVKITVSGVPPLISNRLLENELWRFGKFTSAFKTISLSCKNPKLRHVQSLRRQVFMFLDSPIQSLKVAFTMKHGDGSYMVYASSGQLKCFECGDVCYKHFACSQTQQAEADTADADILPPDNASEAERREQSLSEEQSEEQLASSVVDEEIAAASSSSARTEDVISGEGQSVEGLVRVILGVQRRFPIARQQIRLWIWNMIQSRIECQMAKHPAGAQICIL